LKTTLIIAQMCVDGGAEGSEQLENMVRMVLNDVIRPQVLRHCSAPKSDDLKELISVVKDVVAAQANSANAKQAVEAMSAAKSGAKKVLELRDSHRRRLAYRNRNTVKKRAEEKIELRKAEKTGAEWDGFSVEDVTLKSGKQENLTPCEKAFRSFDMDNDSVITIDEVINYLLSVKPEERPRGLEDVNPFKKPKMRKRLEKMDTDKDGTLSFEEFETWWMQTNHDG